MRTRRWAVVGISVLALILFLCQPVSRLIVRSEESPRWLLTIPLNLPEEVTIQFLHSYDRGFVWEHYAIDARRTILLSGLTLQSFLNGQGFVGGEATIEGGLGRVRHINRPMEKISFFLGSIADHHLIIAQKSYRLLSLAGSGDVVVITAEEKPRAVWFWDFIHEESLKVWKKFKEVQ
ncbi:MAG: hypothetical protein H6Q42_3092 [Deltaproteobacteria bacterium]|nr:hypothetical protein [Deltaproteobacteria bacterium]